MRDSSSSIKNQVSVLKFMQMAIYILVSLLKIKNMVRALFTGSVWVKSINKKYNSIMELGGEVYLMDTGSIIRQMGIYI